MKKISSKIVLLSIINSVIVAVINVISSMIMSMNNQVITPPTEIANEVPQMHGLFGMPSTILIGLLISLIIGIVLAYFFGRMISKPIQKITDLTIRTAQLDLREDEELAKSIGKYKDEVGQMGTALISTRTVLKDMVNGLQGFSSNLATHASQLANQTDTNVHAITQVVSTIDEITVGNMNQAEVIGKINETLIEVVNQIEQITNEAATGADYAVTSLNAVRDGERTIDEQKLKMNQNIEVSIEANKSMRELNNMIDQVKGISALITSIAQQTNLLALNASIEASRAGESGKSFAVVASEIRSLAEETSHAAKNITDLIEKTAEQTEFAVSHMNKSGELIEEQKLALKTTESAFQTIKNTYNHIATSFSHAAEAMETINLNSKGIANQTEDMTKTAESFAASTQQISASGQEQMAIMETISISSKDLSNLADKLQKDLGAFQID